jgi:hypothetical protein
MQYAVAQSNIFKIYLSKVDLLKPIPPTCNFTGNFLHTFFCQVNGISLNKSALEESVLKMWDWALACRMVTKARYKKMK